MLKELSEDLNSIKKIQLEMKDSLTEIKNNLQGNNSRVDDTKNLINDLEPKEAKNNQSEQQEEKRIQKKWGKYKQSPGQLQEVQHHIIGVPEREEKDQEIGNLIEKIMKEDFPNLVK